MDRRIEVKYDRKIFDSITRQHWFHRMSWAPYIMFAPIFIAVPVAAYYAGRWSWVVAIVCAYFIYYALQPLRSYIATMRLARKKFTESETSVLIYHLTDSYLATESDVGRAEVYWKGLYGILKFRHGWILQFPHELNFVLPMRDTDEEIQQFIESKLAVNIAAKPAPTPVLFRSSDY